MKNQRVRLSAEFAKLRLFLEEEEQLFLQRLSEEEEETKKKQNENTLKLHQKITSLKQLILEVREKSESSTLELLKVRPAGRGGGGGSRAALPGLRCWSSELRAFPREWETLSRVMTVKVRCAELRYSETPGFTGAHGLSRI